MVSIQEALSRIKNQELRENSLNFNDAYDSVLQEERSANQDITQVANELYERNLANLNELKQANTRALIGQNALDTSLEFANAQRRGLSENVAGQLLRESRQDARQSFSENEAQDASLRSTIENNRMNQLNADRVKDAALVQNLQVSQLNAAFDNQNIIDQEGRTDERTIAKELRNEATTGRLSDKQLTRDINLQNIIDRNQAEIARSSIDPAIAAAFGLDTGGSASGINLPSTLPQTGSGGSNISTSGIDFIKSFEGFSPTVYNDPIGIPTQGYGLTGSQIVGGSITEAEASSRLESLVKSNYLDPVLSQITVPLNQNQLDAIASFSYNLGPGKGGASDLVPLINAGRFDEVASLMRKYVNAGGNPLPGLIRRRNAEAELFLTN